MPNIRSSRLYLCYYRIWCVMPWLLVVSGQVQGNRLCVRDVGRCSSSFSHPGRTAPDRRPPVTKVLHTMCGNNTSIVSSSWWWACKCPKHVEQITSAINHSAASRWFSSLRIYVLIHLISPLQNTPEFITKINHFKKCQQCEPRLVAVVLAVHFFHLSPSLLTIKPCMYFSQHNCICQSRTDIHLTLSHEDSILTSKNTASDEYGCVPQHLLYDIFITCPPWVQTSIL